MLHVAQESWTPEFFVTRSKIEFSVTDTLAAIRDDHCMNATSRHHATGGALMPSLPAAVARTPVRDLAEPYLTVAEAARHLRVSAATIRRWIARGHVPAARFGRTLRVPAHAVRTRTA